MSRVGYTEIVGAAADGVANAGWFGDGRDGAMTVAANQTHKEPVEEDVGQIIKQYKDFTIEAGGVWTPQSRCNGAVVLVRGNLSLDGTIDMSLMSPLTNDAEAEAKQEIHVALANTTENGELIGGNGGRGGDNGGAGGKGTWNGGAFGGGGGPNGGSSDPKPPHGIAWPWTGTTSGKQQYGVGAPNNISSSYARGGAAPGGSMASVYRLTDERDGTNIRRADPGIAGNAYGGGAIWIYVMGDVEIGANGKIISNGGQGAKGTRSTQESYYVGDDGSVEYGGSVTYNGSGGSAGGGIIFITYAGKFINHGSNNIHAKGGAAPDPYNTSADARAVVGQAGTDGKVVIVPFQELLKVV